jgi:hypothetical protein
MGDDFCSNFLANFLADFVVSLIVGLPLAWWVGRRLNTLAQVQQHREERKADIEKGITYLEFLRKEVGNLLSQLPDKIAEFEKAAPGRISWIPTPYWAVLHPSGELSRLISPSLLERLAAFYDHLAKAKRGMDLLASSWLVPQSNTVEDMPSKQQAFKEMTLSGLTEANKLGKLPNEIELEVRELRKYLDDLNRPQRANWGRRAKDWLLRRRTYTRG